MSWQPHAGRVWSLTLATFTERAADDLMALLTSEGPLLWQPHDSVSTRSWWASIGDVSEEQTGDRSGAWELTFRLDEVDRPDPYGYPMRMPHWGWDDAVFGLSGMPAVAATYPTMWDLMLAGIGAAPSGFRAGYGGGL